MGALDGEWVDSMPVDSIMPAGEGDLLAVEETLDDGNRLREPLDPGASGVETQPGFVVLRFHVPSAQADLKPAIGQEVGRRRLTRHQHGVAEVVVEHVGPNAKPLRRCRSAHQRRHGGEDPGKVVRHSEDGVS